MKTRAAVLRALNAPFSVEPVELDPPHRGEVLVRMVAAGVCQSDLHFITGHRKTVLPVVRGHEGAGVVEAVGEGVTRVAPGDHVIQTFIASCGHCAQCRRGRLTYCLTGFGGAGTMLDGTYRIHGASGEDIATGSRLAAFSEHSVVPENNLIAIPESVPLTSACLLSCGVATGMGAALNIARVEPGDSVAVFGIGGVGLAALQGAVIGGAGEVIAVDINPAKEAVARDFGATRFIDARGEVLQEIRDATQGQGADNVILTIDHVRAEHIALGIEATAAGGITVLVGAADEALDHILAYPARMVRAQKTFTGTLAGGPNPPQDALRYLRLYQAGRLRLDDFVTRTYPLDDINVAVDDLRAGQNIRGVIVMDQNAS
jgi:S-(hydroxymethyl)glutathione dehydrogenase/alcohol dehydrogenase